MGFIVESSLLVTLLGVCAVDSTTFYFEVRKTEKKKSFEIFCFV